MPRPVLNIVGKKFGLMTVLRYIGKDKHRQSTWECLCDCGEIKIVSRRRLLRNGYIASCGCLNRKDLSGKRFGKLVVIRFAGCQNYKCGKLLKWICICDCGKEVELIAGNLRNNEGGSQSCGCNHLLDYKFDDFGLSNRNNVISKYRMHAKENNRDWDLSDEECKILFESNCHYCGNKPSNIMRSSNSKHPYKYNGLDRKDNSLGYTIDNVVSCCKWCNYAKRERSYEEFIKWAVQLGNNLMDRRDLVE